MNDTNPHWWDMYMMTEPRGINESSVSNFLFINVSKVSSTGCLRPPYRFKTTRSNMPNILRSLFLYFFLLHLSSSSSSCFWWAGITFDFACPIFLCLSSVRISDRYLWKSSTPSSSLSLENWIESLVENLVQIRKYVNVSTNLKKSVLSVWNESEFWARNLSLSLSHSKFRKPNPKDPTDLSLKVYHSLQELLYNRVCVYFFSVYMICYVVVVHERKAWSLTVRKMPSSFCLFLLFDSILAYI